MEETVEHVAEAAVNLSRWARRDYINLVAVAATTFVGGGALSWLVAKKHYTAKYEQIIEAEVADAKRVYSRLYKKDDYSTPEGAAEALGVSPKLEKAVEALTKYQGRGQVVDEEVVEETTIERNIFVEARTVPDEEEEYEFDYETELANRSEEAPYILSYDEYFQGEKDYRQVTLTYFAEDGVLVDENEKPIEEIDMVVGEDNLLRFGHGSKDNRIVYVRNDKIELDFEVVKSDGAYSKEVLGFQHSDERYERRRRSRRIRGDDE